MAKRRMTVGGYWKTPAWNTEVERADGVEAFSLPERDIVPHEGWPDAFWRHVGTRVRLGEADAGRVLQLFRELEAGESARCHMPPWGLAFYAAGELLFTVTLCFMCSNAYVYGGSEKTLRAFDQDGPNAVALRELLAQHLPLSE